jgi:hypothetical protein
MYGGVIRLTVRVKYWAVAGKKFYFSRGARQIQNTQNHPVGGESARDLPADLYDLQADHILRVQAQRIFLFRYDPVFSDGYPLRCPLGIDHPATGRTGEYAAAVFAVLFRKE